MISLFKIRVLVKLIPCFSLLIEYFFPMCNATSLVNTDDKFHSEPFICPVLEVLMAT